MIEEFTEEIAEGKHMGKVSAPLPAGLMKVFASERKYIVAR